MRQNIGTHGNVCVLLIVREEIVFDAVRRHDPTEITREWARRFHVARP